MKKVNMFCFSYAGGTATFYTKWRNFLHESINIIPVELPGRGRRFGEALLNNMADVVNDLYNSIQNQLDDSEYMMYGHSMGTAVIYEIMDKIYSEGHKKPSHVFLSGRYPPHVPCGHKDVYEYPEDRFIDYITNIGGTPKELFENNELKEIFVPILRSDYRVIETYQFTKRDYIWNFDISVLNGTEDEEVKPEDIEKWKDYTTGKCKIYYFDGGHFFIHDNSKQIADIINSVVKELKNMPDSKKESA